MAGDNNYSLGPVPNTARKGVASLTMVMLGLTFSPQVCGLGVLSVLGSPLMIFSSLFSSVT